MINPVATKTRSLFGQVWRFLFIGTSNALVDFMVYFFLTRVFLFWQNHYLTANAIAFTLANLNSFIWNRSWTFQAQAGSPWRQYVEFYSASLVYLAFIQAGLWLLVSYWGMYDLLAKIIVIGLGIVFYFIVLRRVVFKPRIKTDFKV